jgi:hypothetical protein
MSTTSIFQLIWRIWGNKVRTNARIQLFHLCDAFVHYYVFNLQLFNTYFNSTAAEKRQGNASGTSGAGKSAGKTSDAILTDDVGHHTGNKDGNPEHLEVTEPEVGNEWFLKDSSALSFEEWTVSFVQRFSFIIDSLKLHSKNFEFQQIIQVFVQAISIRLSIQSAEGVWIQGCFSANHFKKLTSIIWAFLFHFWDLKI